MNTITNAQKIKEARISLGLSQSQFARALGLTRKQTVSDWERGIKEPRPYVWLAIQSLKAQQSKS